MVMMHYKFTEGLKTQFGDTVLVEMYKKNKPIGTHNRLLLDELNEAIAEVEATHTLPYGDAVVISGVPTFAHVAIALYFVEYPIIATHYKASKEYIVVKTKNRIKFPIGYRVPEVDHTQGTFFNNWFFDD